MSRNSTFEPAGVNGNLQGQLEPDQIELDDEGILDLISGTFKDHADGIPEWVKNSSDMYRRREVGSEDSHIIVLSRNRRKGERASAIGCLDFGGMTVKHIEEKFRRWGDPEASGRDEHTGVTGGHGNGGKAYMLSMFEKGSYLHTLRGGEASKYGFPPDSKQPVWVPAADGRMGKGYSISDPHQELNQALELFDLTIEDLPAGVRDIWKERQGFTLVVGFGPEACGSRLPNKGWINELRWHAQMIHVMQVNQIRWFHNGDLVDEADPLKPEPIPPHPVAKETRKINVPDTLEDPRDGTEVSTREEGVDGYLELLTSEPKMNTTKWESRHKIYGWADEGWSTGYWNVNDLSTAAYAKHIYGNLYLPKLEEYEQNARREHANGSLTRALERWMGEQITEYAREFSEYERSQATQEQRDELSQMNDALNRWTSSFLSEELGGIDEGDGDGTSDDDDDGLPSKPVEQIELSLTHSVAGQGVSLNPRKKFFGEDGEQVQAIPNTLKSSAPEVASVDGSTVNTHQPGTAELWVSCAASPLESNRVTIEVLKIDSVEVVPQELEVESGSRAPLEASVTTKNGFTHEGVYLSWMEGDDEIASVGSSGMVHGRRTGETTITAYDDQQMGEPARVTVTPASEEPGSNGGDGSPKILLSEVDDDPLGEDPPEFSPEEPPVHQRTYDVEHNIWWINMASPLARRLVERSDGDIRESPEWRQYHVERYVEIVSKIIAAHEFGEEETSFSRVIRTLNDQATEMQHRIADSLNEFLDSGILPGKDDE